MARISGNGGGKPGKGVGGAISKGGKKLPKQAFGAPKRQGAWAPKSAPRVRVRPKQGNAGVGGKVKVRAKVKKPPRTAADSNPTPKLKRVGHANAKGIGFEPGKGIKSFDNIVKALAPPGVQAPDRPRVDITKGALKSHPVPKGAKQQVAGFSPESSKAAKAAGNIAWVVPASTAVTVYHQPGRTIGDTAKSVVGIPAGLVRTALNPSESAKGIVKDYERRYSAAAKGDYSAFHKRQMKEGAVPEAFDIATVATAGGAATGRLVQKAAEAGKLGKGAERVATQATKLRVTGGEDGVKVRAPSKNFYKNAANATRHKIRVRRQVKRAARPDAPGIVREAMNDPVLKSIARHNRKVAKRGGRPVSAKATRAAVSEATPVLKRTAKRAQIHDVADQGGRTLQRMKAEQTREVHSTSTGVAASLRGLSKDERAAWKYQAQYAPKSPEAARRVLKRHRQRVVAERAKSGSGPIVDELPTIDRLIANADKAFTPRLRDRVRVENNRSRRLAAQDPGLTDAQALRRAHMPAGELLGVKPIEGEGAVQYARRVRQAGVGHDLGAPAYFKSEEIPRGIHAVFAKGGTRAVREDRAYSGALTRTGRESGDVNIVTRAAAGNIKRRYNWNLVADTVDRHVFGWSKKRRFTAYELEREIRRRGIDPNSVALWNPRLFAESRKGVSAAEHLPDADTMTHDAQLAASAQHATASLGDLRTNRSDFRSAGWQLAPKDVIDEVMDTARARRGEGPARAYDITKGQVSRVLLANPAWLGFQVGSNALMTGLAGATPLDAARSAVFFRRLKADPAFKADVEAVFGAHGWFNDKRHMGAHGGSMTRAWGAVKDTAFYRRALEGKSPLDALFFRPDNAQNNFFRRTIMYNRVKREAYAQMNRDASTIARAQSRIAGALKGNPEEQMRAILRNRKAVEDHARAVDDFLGNWTRYTARERNVFSRFVMFYGFLRFATRLAFYTMPVKHPIMSSILLQIGRLEHDEIKQIFGTEPPPWEIGNLYAPTTGTGAKPKGSDANVRIPTVRLVPFFNALQYSDSPGSVIGMLHPAAGIAANQIAGKNVPLDQPYTVRGSTAYVTHSSDLSAVDRARLAVAEVLHLSPWERALEAAFLRGKQSSDSSIVFPEQMRYSGKTAKSREAIARNKKLVAQQNESGPARNAVQVLLPQLGVGSQGQRRITSAQQWAKAEREKKAKKSDDPWGVKQGSSSPDDPWGLKGGKSSSSPDDPWGVKGN